MKDQMKVDLSTTRPGIQTNKAVKELASLPSYVHKWSRERRPYCIDELLLPCRAYIKGCATKWEWPIVAVGGTRSPTVESFRAATEVVRRLALRSLTIVSGGVPGIDLAGHLAALDAGGRTYAVLANPATSGLCGHEWSNSIVEAGMLKCGGFISEYDKAVDVFSAIFLERLLERDRIISGLCDVFLVFECREDSATVDTAKRALLQGKAVFSIEAGPRTERVGQQQLAREYSVPILSLSKASVDEIANTIYEALVSKELV